MANGLNLLKLCIQLYRILSMEIFLLFADRYIVCYVYNTRHSGVFTLFKNFHQINAGNSILRNSDAQLICKFKILI